MVYIYKKTVGGRVYYYLRASVRVEGKQVVRDIAYVGNSLEEIQKALTKLPKYEKEIRKTYKTLRNFIESNRYLEKVKVLKLKRDSYLGDRLNEVEACKMHYNSMFQRQNKKTQEEVYKQFIIEFAFNTASIEGNTITLKQAKELLEEGITPKGKTLREIYDIQNTERVFNELLIKKEAISHESIIAIHESLLKNIDVRVGYRTQDIHVVKANFKSSPKEYIQTDMTLLLEWYTKHKKELHPLVLAMLFHHKFEKIHPFFDGNGRTGRMIMNYILMKNGYPPIIIHNRLRNIYLNAMRKADASAPTRSELREYKELIEYGVNECIATYWNTFLL